MTTTLARAGNPIDVPQRIRGVDLARSVAIIGMIAVHVIDTDLFVLGEPSTWLALANGNSSVLFATLAGVSLALSNGGAHPPSGDRLARGRRSLLRRGLVVWGIGVVLAFTGVPVNIILTAYGLLFLIATLMLGLRVRTLLIIATVLAMTMPFLVFAIDGQDRTEYGLVAELLGWYYPFPVWATYIALGLAAGRILRSRPSPALPAAILAVVGVALTVLGHRVLGPLATRAQTTGPEFLAVFTVEAHSSGIGNVVGASGLALFVIGASVLVCLTPVHWVLWPLRALGSMPLTAYVAHILSWFLWLIWTYSTVGPVNPLDGFRAVEPFWPTVIALLIGSSLWVWFVGRGPLERFVGWASTPSTTPARHPAPLESEPDRRPPARR